jgi:hypothetical protein
MFPFLMKQGEFTVAANRDQASKKKIIFWQFEEFLELEKKVVFWKEEKASFGKDEKRVENCVLN